MKVSKCIVVAIALAISFIGASAQPQGEKSKSLLFFDNYKPAKVILTSGKVLNQKHANVFLKNGHLLYMRGNTAMQANSKQLRAVAFEDMYFWRVDSVLAYVVDKIVVDSLKEDFLLCSPLLDMESYRNQVINSQHLTNLSLGDNIGMTSLDATEEDRVELPIRRHYYFRVNGIYIKVHERDIKRAVSKETFRRIRGLMNLPDFSWSDEKMLMDILKLISQEKMSQAGNPSKK